MKVDKILFVSDENLNYLTFWNSISRYYTKRFGFKCKLFFIGEKTDENKEWLSEEYGEVEVVKPLKDIPIIIQALWGKFWFTQTEPDTCWLIGDIDMYIFDKDYVDSALASIPDNGYGHISASDKEWYFYGYHHCASGKKFKEFLSLSDSFEDDCKFIFESKKLIIELDGTQHRKTVEQDAIRDKWFSTKGYKVIRIPVDEFKKRYFLKHMNFYMII